MKRNLRGTYDEAGEYKKRAIENKLGRIQMRKEYRQKKENIDRSSYAVIQPISCTNLLRSERRKDERGKEINLGREEMKSSLGLIQFILLV